ncbi:MAG: hypothetical protein BGO09_00580 [Bacteroidetes bacterium 47-18]|nr:MAG: hypothetical protein BGO09_00580 [Bacteroidetes bacterium 47-18]
MTTAEILSKVRKIEIKTKGLSNHIFSGDYHAAFKGKGMSFSEVREYIPGDDVRAIDWNVTARLSTPYIKVFEEEREQTLMLLADISNSSIFGSTHTTKKNIITELCAVLAFSANANNDKVGLLLFSNKVEKFIPPQKGKSHILRIIRELLTTEASDKTGTDITQALSFFNNVIRQKTICFLISDFLSPPFEKPLRLAARKHDFIGVSIYDKMDRELPDVGVIEVVDSETKALHWVDTGSKKARNAYTELFDRHQKYCIDQFHKNGANLISMRTDQDYVKKLKGFFNNR